VNFGEKRKKGGASGGENPALKAQGEIRWRLSKKGNEVHRRKKKKEEERPGTSKVRRVA